MAADLHLNTSICPFLNWKKKIVHLFSKYYKYKNKMPNCFRTKNNIISGFMLKNDGIQHVIEPRILMFFVQNLISIKFRNLFKKI